MTNHELPASQKVDMAASTPHTTAFYPPVQLAQAYVPWQRYGKTYSPGEALEKGTLFPELYSHYPY